MIAQNLPETGSLKRFVVFSSVGLITNSGTSYYTGDVGNNAGLTTGFGNFDGNSFSGDATSQQGATDLSALVNELNGLTCTMNMLSITATDTRFTAGVYCVSLGATLADSIVLDAQNDPNAVFVFNINGSLSFPANTKVYLLNGAQACRVFWNVSGLVNVGANSTIKGNIIGSNMALNAISLNADVNLEGRVFATSGTITLNSITAARPLGCGLPVQTGPASPNLRNANCFALFTSAGALTNTGITTVDGSIGTHTGPVTGFVPANISKGIFLTDATTLKVKTDVDLAFNYINALPVDIELQFPLVFGNKLKLTPHVYLLNSNTMLSDTLFIDAQGNSNAVFVIKVNGTFNTSAGAKVVLLNGAKSCNVFWLASGAVTLGATTKFIGSVITGGAITSGAGTLSDGRLITRAGAITVDMLTAAIPNGCGGCPYNAANNAPNAVNDLFAISEDANTVVINVLNNDNDPDGDLLTVSIVSNAKRGTSSTNGTTVSYKPNANFNGIDTIVYRVCDNGTPSLCDTALVIINVTAVNDKPVAADDSATTVRNLPVSVPVLQNDSDPDGNPLIVSLITQPDNGTALVTGASILYTPDPGFAGYDTFYYRICDNGTPALCDTAMVVINVSAVPINFRPVAAANTVSVCRNSDTNFIYVQNNDYDPNGDSLVTSIVSFPKSGNASVINNSAIAFVPQQDFTGYDTIVYQVCDSQFCDTSFVYIRVYPAPVANAGPDRTIEFGDSIMIGADSLSGNAYLWEPRDHLSDPYAANPYANPPATITYTLTQTSRFTGCSSKDEMVVTVTGDGFYNGLSPNNDGVNDSWNIPALNKYPKNFVTVINRYGSEVWKATDYDNNNVKFTGTNLDGDELPDGTYFYVINYNNSKKEGWLIIKR
ncbi:MAG: ice-binding family protein [Bacteroidota bacterium]